MREAVRAAIDAEGDGPVRILALAAGPAIELRRLLEQAAPMRRPVELILLDQDRSAARARAPAADAHLARAASRRRSRSRCSACTFRCASSSSRRRPRTQRVVRETLADLDSSTRRVCTTTCRSRSPSRLTRLLYARLRAGRATAPGQPRGDARHHLGDGLRARLAACAIEPTSRCSASPSGLAPGPSSVGITRDETGHCLFLDVTRATSD